MLLPYFVFHTTDGLQNGEAVLLSSNMLFKKMYLGFSASLKKSSAANLGVCCTTCLIWCGHSGICLWLTNVSKSPDLLLC